MLHHPCGASCSGRPATCTVKMMSFLSASGCGYTAVLDDCVVYVCVFITGYSSPLRLFREDLCVPVGRVNVAAAASAAAAVRDGGMENGW